MKFFSWKWIVKTDDFAHWYTVSKSATEEACAGVKVPTMPQVDCNGCPTHIPGFGRGKDAENPATDGNAVQQEEEQLILNHLRSSPSLVQSSSMMSASVAKRGDAGSTGSNNTHPESDNESEGEEESKSNSKFTLWLVFASVLALLSIGLVVALLMNRRMVRLRDENGGLTDVMTNSSEVDTGSHVYTIEGHNSTSMSMNLDGDILGTGAVNTSGEGQKGTDEVVTFDYTANTDYLVGAYYYPWYSEDFHRGAGYVRKNLMPPQMPMLGEYDDSDPEVIKQHMAWFRQANIGLLVTSWWGPDSTEDNTTKSVIMEHEDIGNLKIALHFETKGRIKDTTDMSGVRSDIQHMCENYFDHPNYYLKDERPVIVVHVTRLLHSEGVLEEAILTMRSEASKCGKNIYIIGDQVFESAPDPDDAFTPFWYFDAVTNFDVYGSSGRPGGFVGKDAVDDYYREQALWKEQALAENCQYIPPVSPGYNDRGVRLEEDHLAMSRRLTQGSEEGSLFWYQLKQALPLVSEDIDNMVLLNSFNEFHEDTQIEPVMSFTRAGVSTNRPPYMTGGLEYAAYGELYLDILGAATSRDPAAQILFDDLYTIPDTLP
mmetsp:Transcript_17261/g.43067  ORF Transcript_17261/g.43067 Transcript_17261/m.43067 type:complete len:600 (+) Transcript_17261:136-1935(+)|eukprot:CAMPEP_0116097480 /NCGR_PEP_ID=MMETSP0327-20121206/10729_1 /TAXON_ID=44447 /ORGANISM="Pseudo-nitzschia delicatissima, Strain B596" /LENGTH=599 /DNA_ID=CAMNT_0003589237 /DNA_START=44 /DNA_END=1843 /DNA_ORIENTATION=+